MTPHISVVTPVYGAVDCLETLYARLVTSLSTITDNFEIIMVNDACPYGSWEIIEKLATQDKRVKGIDLYRNFGQHVAITAGVNSSKGDWVVVMDCDLQDQPEDIPILYQKALEGNEVVFGIRGKRKDSLFKKITSTLYRVAMNTLSKVKWKYNNANFSIISRGIANAYNQLNDKNRIYFIQINWIYNKIAYVKVNHDKRYAGSSSYNMKKLLYLAINILVANSYKPLLFASVIGFGMIIVSIVLMFKIILSYLFLGTEVLGWSSLMIVVLLTSGIILFNLGVMSLYIWKTFEETKNKPLYFIKQRINFK